MTSNVWKLSVISVISVAVSLILAGCSDSSTTSSRPVVGTPVDAATAGAISIQVNYDGVVPVAKAIDMRTVPQCAAAHPGPVFDQPYWVTDGHLGNAVVWIKAGLENWVFSTLEEPVEIDQKGCLYAPRVAAAMVGQTVRFKNSDQEAHNVHGRPKIVDSWNFIMSRTGSTRDLRFSKPEVAVPIGCDVHPWMSGYLAVVANPYFGVTGKDGTVRLQNVPPGDYVVAAWHEKLGIIEKPVTLAPRGAIDLQLSFGNQG